MITLLCLALVPETACGRIGFDSVASDADIGIEDAIAAIDAMSETYSTPTPVTILSDVARDDDPSATGDLLELYYNSERVGGQGDDDIWVSRRASVTEAWGAPEPVVELNSAFSDGNPEVSRDGLTMYLSSPRPPAVGRQDIFVATRPNRASPWGTPTHVPELSTVDGDYAAALSPDGLTLVVSSDRANTNSSAQLFLATRATVQSAWSTPAPISELNVAGESTSDAVFGDDSNQLFFQATRDGGLSNIYTAQRPSSDQPFGAIDPIDEINSAFNDTDIFVSPDQRQLFFASDRSGESEIYEAVR